MNDELMIDGLLWVIYLMIAVALCLALFSVWRSYRASSGQHRLSPTLLAFLVLPIVLLLAWLLSGSIVAMFVDSILVMLLLAIVAVCLSAIHTKFLR